MMMYLLFISHTKTLAQARSDYFELHQRLLVKAQGAMTKVDVREISNYLLKNSLLNTE